ncbi:MAG: oligosaccharide flippase family protein [Longimicrobiales bacterium]|nr:oligosaccharide flippase family protein [Longimicrobiales bacterium]
MPEEHLEEVKSPTPSERLSRIRRNPVARDAAVLYLAHALALLVPLATIPYLARVLGPQGWGLVVFSQSLGAWLALVIEYGFDLSGTREIARHRDDHGHVARTVAGVQGAKLLVCSALVGLIVLLRSVPAFAAEPRLLWWATAFALARGVSPAWYFFGVERLRLPALMESAAKVTAAAGIFLLIREPGDGWKVLALQAVTMGTVVLVMTFMMYRRVALLRPRLNEAVRTLREGVGVFVFRSASGVYLQANGFILGLLAAPSAVAFFGGAEKIVRAGVNLFQPLSQTLFPRISHLAVRDNAAAARTLRVGMVIMGAMGLALMLTLFMGAPFLVNLLLGPGYDEAVPLVRLLALLPPIIAVGTMFGIQWALPAGLERPFYLLVVAAGLVNIAMAFVLVPRLGAFGMGLGVVTAELLVALGLLVVFRNRSGRFWPLTFPVSKAGKPGDPGSRKAGP